MGTNIYYHVAKKKQEQQQSTRRSRTRSRKVRHNPCVPLLAAPAQLDPIGPIGMFCVEWLLFGSFSWGSLVGN